MNGVRNPFNAISVVCRGHAGQTKVKGGKKVGRREGGRRDGTAPSVKLIMYCEIASSSPVSPLRRSPSLVASGQTRQGGSHSLSRRPKRDRDSPAVDPDVPVRLMLKKTKLGVYGNHTMVPTVMQPCTYMGE